MSFKKVYFHKMSMYKGVIRKVKGKDVFKKEYKSPNELNEKMKIILSKHLTNNCIRLHNEERVDILEILKKTPKFIYARIGNKKDIAAVHLRDNKTLIAAPIAKTPQQDIEIFTYLLIDRENFIISYLREMSAPSIQKLGNIIDTYFKESDQLYSEISSIMIEDAIPLLKSKDVISSIDYKMSVPINELINIDALGLTEKEYDMISNEKNVTLSVNLVAERNKSLFTDEEEIPKFLRKVMNKTKKVKVKAKNVDEYSQLYTVLDSVFCKNVKFDFNLEDDIQKEIYNKLIQVYKNNKEEIIKYTK